MLMLLKVSNSYPLDGNASKKERVILIKESAMDTLLYC